MCRFCSKAAISLRPISHTPKRLLWADRESLTEGPIDFGSLNPLYDACRVSCRRLDKFRCYWLPGRFPQMGCRREPVRVLGRTTDPPPGVRVVRTSPRLPCARPATPALEIAVCTQPASAVGCSARAVRTKCEQRIVRFQSTRDSGRVTAVSASGRTPQSRPIMGSGTGLRSRPQGRRSPFWIAGARAGRSGPPSPAWSSPATPASP